MSTAHSGAEMPHKEGNLCAQGQKGTISNGALEQVTNPEQDDNWLQSTVDSERSGTNSETVKQNISPGAKMHGDHLGGHPIENDLGNRGISPDISAKRERQFETAASEWCQTLPGGSSASNKKLKVQQLTEQAEKMMIAVDGAKQLEAEKLKLKKIKANQVVSTGSLGEVVNHAPQTPAQQAATVVRERQRSAALKYRQERFGSVLSGDSSTNKIKRPEGLAKYGSSSLRGSSQARSSSPASGEGLSGSKGRTLTPHVPSSASSDLKASIGLGSSPLSTKSSASMGAPLRSAMKRPASSLRRSVSQVSFAGTQYAAASESRVDQAPAASLPKSTEMLTSGLASSTRPSWGPNPKKKIQSKLQVIRNRKMKGRVDNAPSPAKPALKLQHVISSDEDQESVSSSISEEDVGDGISKAGPSSKRKSTSGTTSCTSSSMSASKALLPSIDPALQATKPIPGTLAQSSESTSETSRSPSDSDDDSDDLHEVEGSQAKTTPVTSNSTSKSLEPTLSPASDPSQGTTSGISRNKGLDASKLLHRGVEGPLSPEQQPKKSIKPRANGWFRGDSRPANFRYPSLSEMKREAEGRTKEPPRPSTKGTSLQEAQTLDHFGMSSDSEDEESDTSSDGDGQRKEKRKSKSGMIPGMAGLLRRVFSNQSSSQVHRG